MWFGEPHPFPERGSPTRLSASGQQSYEGWSCRLFPWHFVIGAINLSFFMSSDFFFFSPPQMLIFSLGKVLQRAVKNTDLEGGNLDAVLASMVHPNPAVRASLMDLFDVSTTVIPLRTDAALMFVMRAENLAVWFMSSPYCVLYWVHALGGGGVLGDFPHLSRPALSPSQPPLQYVPGFSWG